MARKPQLRDCVYGQAVGDALGVPYEFGWRGQFICTGMVGGGAHDQPAGTWSDDTSMMLAICDSYRALHRIDCEDIRTRFRAWYDRGAYTVDGLFDIGNTVMNALNRGVGALGEQSNGNGSLMRTVPLAFTPATDDEIRAVSAITHAHAISMNACVDAVAFARDLMAGEDPAEAAAAIGYAGIADVPEDDISSGGFVLDTLRAALWCLITTDNYADCVLRAVNLGHDSDTTAAVAGAFAGIVYGEEAIPAEWRNTLRGRKVIEKCLFA